MFTRVCKADTVAEGGMRLVIADKHLRKARSPNIRCGSKKGLSISIRSASHRFSRRLRPPPLAGTWLGRACS